MSRSCPGFLIFVSAFTFIEIGCKKNDPAPVVLRADSAHYALPGGNNAKLTINFHSNAKWTALTSARWLNITPVSGDGDATIQVSATAANNSDSDRVANVTITATNDPAAQPFTIDVTQKSTVVAMIWSNLYGGTDNDDIRAITATPDGGYLLAGYTTGNAVYENHSHGIWDALVIKTDANGNKQWSKLYGGSQYDVFNSVVSTGDGFILAGFTQSTDGDISVDGYKGQADAWLLKIDANGEKVWSKTFGGSGNDFATCITSAWDGGYVVTGRGDSQDFDLLGNHNYLEDAWLFRIDDNGTKMWSHLYGGTGWDQAWNIIKTEDHGYAISGYSMSNDGDLAGSHGDVDGWVMKTDIDGNKTWISVLGGSGTDNIGSIIQTDDGGFLGIGSSRSSDGDLPANNGFFDGWVFKLNASGSKQWSRVFGGVQRDEGIVVAKLDDSSYLAIFNSQIEDCDTGGGFLNPDILALKLDANGEQLWKKTFGGPYWDAAYTMLPSPGGGFMLAGQTDSNAGSFNGNHGLQDGFMMKIKTPE